MAVPAFCRLSRREIPKKSAAKVISNTGICADFDMSLGKNGLNPLIQ